MVSKFGPPSQWPSYLFVFGNGPIKAGSHSKWKTRNGGSRWITITSLLCRCPGGSMSVRNGDVASARNPISSNHNTPAFNSIPSSLCPSMPLFERYYIASSDRTIMYAYAFPFLLGLLGYLPLWLLNSSTNPGESVASRPRSIVYVHLHVVPSFLAANDPSIP